MELTIYLQLTYFQYNEEFYEQTGGLAMGSLFSPILADIFMEDFEETALLSTPTKSSFYRRYVDDTFMIWPHGHENLPAFLEHLNSIDKKIHCPYENRGTKQFGHRAGKNFRRPSCESRFSRGTPVPPHIQILGIGYLDPSQDYCPALNRVLLY
ncbi:uncharacterized protein LOC143245600 [Tachypleus tridentatus]|uniref:uncharacterized protein LOC143245600 n=1 Tax=Tachypleus tridentatus TaxID=6853 RepID=UPI003FD0F2C2